MTKLETERLAIVETNQNNMSNDIQEMKNDIKEIKKLLTKADDRYISKHFSKWVEVAARGNLPLTVGSSTQNVFSGYLVSAT